MSQNSNQTWQVLLFSAPAQGNLQVMKKRNVWDEWEKQSVFIKSQGTVFQQLSTRPA